MYFYSRTIDEELFVKYDEHTFDVDTDVVFGVHTSNGGSPGRVTAKSICYYLVLLVS